MKIFKNFQLHLNLLFTAPKDYLYSYRYDKTPVEIRPFDPAWQRTARKIASRIRKLCPGLKVNLIGSVGLGIDGRGDVDLYAGASQDKLLYYYQKLEKVFGKPVKVRRDYRDWKFEYLGMPVELHVTEVLNIRYQSQLHLFNLLKNNPKYLRMYQNIKRAFSGRSNREYVLARMEFFNKILR